jgi:hypothetical protein
VRNHDNYCEAGPHVYLDPWDPTGVHNTMRITLITSMGIDETDTSKSTVIDEEGNLSRLYTPSFR